MIEKAPENRIGVSGPANGPQIGRKRNGAGHGPGAIKPAPGARVGRRGAVSEGVGWPADSIERRPIGALKASAKNARLHSDAQVAQIAVSIQEFGFTVPVLVDEGNEIIAGHGRVLAARKLRLSEVPVVVARGWSEAQKLAYLLADNKLTENGEWDEELLRQDLQELAAADFGIELTGFSQDELDKLARDPDEADLPDDIDAEAPLSEVAVSRRGDLWLLDQHRLLCGDSTNGEDVRRLLAGAKPNLMVTDPPYGVEYDADWRNHAFRANGSPIAGRAIGKVSNDDRSDWSEAYALFPGDVAYVWAPPGPTQFEFFKSIERSGLKVRMQIIWAKSHFPIGRGDYHVQHEPCWYAVREGAAGHWCGDRKQTTVWQIDKPQKSETGHSTQKPIECMRRPMENNSNPGESVYDPFVGSGTTIIAAEMSGRAALALEIAPNYVDVAIRRWQALTHKSATLLGGGSFEDVERERNG